MEKDNALTFCVLVTYNPDSSQLKNTLSSLLSQVDRIVIVKNSAERLDFDDVVGRKIHLIHLERNMGIAYAQNRGIEYALACGADFVLFSDQDTVYPADFTAKSLACWGRHEDERVAAVVPLFYNENKHQLAAVSVTKTKAVAPDTSGDMLLAHAISSGTVAAASALREVGMMNERLFIDWVDAEWCWRAAKAGFGIICDTANVIHHSMGDHFKTVLGRKIVVYSDFRNYFFLRNGFYLLFHSHLFRKGEAGEWFGFFRFMAAKSILFSS